MATSGTTSFDLTIEEIIAESYERCGLYVRSGYDLKTSRRSLNLLFAAPLSLSYGRQLEIPTLKGKIDKWKQGIKVLERL